MSLLEACNPLKAFAWVGEEEEEEVKEGKAKKMQGALCAPCKLQKGGKYF